MLFWWLACKSASLTGDSPPDSGEPPDPPVPWPALALSPSWESSESDVSTGLAFADLDQDGDGDLIVANGNDVTPGPLRVYLNEGGLLPEQASWSSASPRFYGQLAAGDLNGDGWVDLAVAVYLGDGGWGQPGGVEVFLNQGGELQPSPSWSASGFYAFSLALGDLDLDGDLDLATTGGEMYQGVLDSARVWENDGQGQLGELPIWEEAVPAHSYDLAWLDADGDGWLDLAIAHSGSAHTLTLNTLGVLSETPAWTADEEGPYEGNTLDWGDLDGDGHLDLVISENEQRGGLGRVRAWCGPRFVLCWTSLDSPDHQSAVSLEDLDGDGDPDLVAGAWWSDVRIYLNEGGLSATPDARTGTNSVIEAFVWEDLDESHREVQTLEGEGLLLVPGRARVLSVSGGVAGDGYISGPGPWTAEVLAPSPRDLGVSNWDKDVGNQLYTRASD